MVVMRLGVAATAVMGLLVAQLVGYGTPALAAQPAPAPLPAADPWMVPPGQAPSYVAPPPDPAMSMATYQNNKRSNGLSLLCEFLVPGLGSIYGEHLKGALITWALLATGVGLLIYGFAGIGSDLDGRESGSDEAQVRFGLVGGLVLLGAGRVHGFVDAWRSTSRYNDGLRTRLGLPGHVSFGPRLRLRF